MTTTRKRDRIGELEAALAELRLENEAQRDTLAALLGANREALLVTDLDGTVVMANETAAVRANLNPGQLIGRSAHDILSPEVADERKARIREVIATGKPAVFEYWWDERWMQSSIYPVSNTRREVVGLAIFWTDITGLKHAEEGLRSSLREKEILLREIHHRVKNNLQIVHSILSLQIKRSGQTEITEVLRDCQNRIRSISLIHQHLYRSKNLARLDMGAYLQSLTHGIERAYRTDDRGIELTVEADGVRLDLNTAIPCGLIVNELVSNSLKHAFSNGLGGRIAVSVEREGKHVQLKVSDNGIGLPPALDLHDVPSLGLQLVTALARQLSGTLSVHGSPGATFAVVFPVGRNVSERRA
jgi:PAS domain S-box-containing protein